MNVPLLLAIAIGVLAVAVVYGLATTLRRMLADDGHLRLAQVLRARKLSLPAPVGGLEINAAALAVRRCTACAERKRCDLAIAERDWKGLARFCPNDEYIRSRTPNGA